MRTHFLKRVIASIVVVLVSPLSAVATKSNTDYYPAGRYTSVAITPTPEQTDLLATIIQHKFPNTVITVGDALDDLLAASGFQLADSNQDNSVQTLLFNLPLPQVHRQLGPMTLHTALTVLGAPSFKVVIHPVKRTIRYQLHNDYQHTITDQDIQAAKTQWAAYQAEKLAPAPIMPLIQSCYGPVKRGETLLGISLKLGLTGVTPSQVMISLLQANPSAFTNQNINQLLAGSPLIIPNPKTIKTISTSKAYRMVKQHDQQWQPLGLTKELP